MESYQFIGKPLPKGVSDSDIPLKRQQRAAKALGLNSSDPR